jgi:glutathione peroxidase
MQNTDTIYAFTVRDAKGAEIPLERFRGKVLLLVNVARKCGFAGQFADLQKLHETHESRGFAVLGFPCNQFGGQEPGSDTEIQQACTLELGISFPIFAKIEVNGTNAHPLYKFLKHQAPGFLGSERIKWNFTKFLVDRNGHVVKRFAPNTAPRRIEPHIRTLLDA